MNNSSENKNKPNPSNNIRALTTSALMVALAMILDQIKLFQMPQGGAVTLFGMLPIILLGYLLGTRWGIIGGTCVGILNLIFGGYVIHPAQLFIDYILSFAVLGLSGLVRDKKNGLTKGYLLGVSAKYICFVLSGWIFFGEYAPENFNALTWSLWYNITFVAVEAAMTLIVINIPAVKNLFTKLRNTVQNY